MRNEGTSFLFVFRSLERALGFCLKVQLDAMQVAWPPEFHQELAKHKAAHTEHAADGSLGALQRGLCGGVSACECVRGDIRCMCLCLCE